MASQQYLDRLNFKRQLVGQAFQHAFGRPVRNLDRLNTLTMAECNGLIHDRRLREYADAILEGYRGNSRPMVEADL